MSETPEDTFCHVTAHVQEKKKILSSFSLKSNEFKIT